jgi:hypothetical protein
LCEEKCFELIHCWNPKLLNLEQKLPVEEKPIIYD